MENKSLKKTFSICAAVLMLISAGGNTLAASAKKYHHHRITRKITHKHISRYQYKKDYALYKLVNRYIRNDKKRLKATHRALKRHKRGRLNRNLKKHQREIMNDIKHNQRISNRLYKRNSHFNKKFSLPTIKVQYMNINDNTKKNKKQAIVKKRVHKPVRKHTYKAKSSMLSTNNSSQNRTHNISSVASISKASASTSSTTVNQSLAQAYNSLKAKSESISASGFYEFGKHGDGLNAYNKYIADPASSINNQINNVKSDESQASLYNPASESAEAWSYINAISNVYNWINNKSDKFSINDETASAYYQKMGDYAYALGHDGNSFAMAHIHNESAALPQLQNWYNQHSINNSTEAKDAWYWNTRNLDGANDPNIYDHILATSDGYSKLHFPLNVIDGTTDSPQPAEGTEAAYNQALDDDAQTGDFNGIEGYIPDD